METTTKTWRKQSTILLNLLYACVGTGLLQSSGCALITDSAFERRVPVVQPEPQRRSFKVTPRYVDTNVKKYDASGFPHRGATAAILTLDPRAGVSADEAALLADRFAVELNRTDTYTLISRAKISEILEVQEYSLACSSTECAVEAGRLLGVQYTIHGSVGRFGSLYTVNVHATSVETLDQVASATIDYQGKPEGLLTDGMRKVAVELLRAVESKHQQ